MATQRRRKAEPKRDPDLNLVAAGLLHDMAALQPTERSRFGYTRAAKAIVGLPVTVKELGEAGALRDVPFVGPSSERIVRELVDTGRSATVEAAFRGDFQMHSSWSDGGERIATMADACLELGHTCLGITDHSYGLADRRWHDHGDRQDIDFELAGRALEIGCIFALDSDAHSIGELRFSEYAIAHARLARIPSDRVINCWSDERLEDRMVRRGSGPG